MKYQNNLMKGSQDIERKSSGTDRQVQSNMPLFFEGGHMFKAKIYKHSLLISNGWML
jgi:hypothetical protein